MTEQSTQEVQEEMNDIKVDTTTIDAVIALANTREYFDLKEVRKIFSDLNDKGIDFPDVSRPVIQWTADRTYTAADLVMNAALDMRNLIAPYPQEVPDAGTQDVLPADSSDND